MFRNDKNVMSNKELTDNVNSLLSAVSSIVDVIKKDQDTMAQVIKALGLQLPKTNQN